MNSAATKKQVETVLAHRCGHIFERREKLLAETLPTGIAEIDRLLHGIPRGAITEIHGAASSGRTSVLLSALAIATAQEDTCALVDCHDTFDVSSAAKATVDFNRLLWVRCSNDLERAFKAVDLLLHGGGFGLVALSIGDLPARAVRRIISSWWFRFRRAIENTSTALIVISPVGCVRSCATLVLELKNEAAVWPSTLSAVSKDFNGVLTEQRRRMPPNLSLVSTLSPRQLNYSLSHSHFFQELCVRVNREQPREWSEATVRFNTRFN